MKTSTKILSLGLIIWAMTLTSCSKESATEAESMTMGESDEIATSEPSTNNVAFSKAEVTLAKETLLIDDFETGSFANMVFGSGTSARTYQTGRGIVGNSLGSARSMYTHVNQNPFEQSFQVRVHDGLMAITAAYDTRGAVYVNYGNNENGLVPLNEDLSKYNNLKIEFAAKSTVNGLYVSFFTGTSRGVYRQHVQAREGYFIVTIPLVDIEQIGPNYELSQIDYMRFQFDSRSKTGCNMAINKIWVE